MNMAEFKVELLGGTPVINKFLFDEPEFIELPPLSRVYKGMG